MLDHFAPLATPRLELRPIGRDLARSIAGGDVSALRTAPGWPQPGTVNGVRMALERGQPAGWLVILDDEVVGDCGVHAPVDEDGRVEIGYGLAEPFRGRGLGTELVSTVSGWLLDHPDVREVSARIERDNAASRRVLERADFEPLRAASPSDDLLTLVRRRPKA